MVSFKSLSSFILASVIGTALANPAPVTRDLAKRGNVLQGQYDSESELGGRFILENNLWGQSSGSGWQKSQATGTGTGNAVIWYTTYSWQGGQYNVKSYANMDLKVGMGKTIAQIGSIPTIFNWHYGSASGDLVADVSYDLWLSRTPGTQGATSSTTYEIMVWLSTRGGAQPAGSRIGTANINGQNWTLWKGTVQNWTVFSYVPPYEMVNFSQDLKPFLTYLVNTQGVPSNQYLVQAQAGTEPFVGTATLNIDWYTMAVN
ncbi:hypothetical protein CVT24_000626 [Panaeolus cyanescens]|uniref:Glycoside hydrolase family 12 protein n=1 Tax=Panaeolus cyanescens TaxID=181874 RepID=A0A409YT78_9AGAR|nr:hypothetical protein CVT24_000626 [Panaeolus cyanescens]